MGSSVRAGAVPQSAFCRRRIVAPIPLLTRCRVGSAAMPTEKRERQRAGREVRRAEAKAAQRRAQRRRQIISIAALVAVVVGIGLLINLTGKDDKGGAGSESTSTTASDQAVGQRGLPRGRRFVGEADDLRRPAQELLDQGGDVLRGRRDRRRHLHHRLGPRQGAEHGQQLRLPGPLPRLRRRSLPPGDPRLRRPGRRRRPARTAAAMPATSSATNSLIRATTRPVRWPWPTAVPTPTARSSSS